MHLPLDADRRLVAQIRASEGVLTREHALQTGLSDRAIDWRVASGRWIRKHPGVYLTQPGNNDWLAEAWAGLLFVGAPAALSGSSAGHAWGLIKEPPRVLEIVTNRPRSARGRPRLTIRRTARFAQIVSRFHTPPANHHRGHGFRPGAGQSRAHDFVCRPGLPTKVDQSRGAAGRARATAHSSAPPPAGGDVE